jgi:hypothetical protein
LLRECLASSDSWLSSLTTRIRAYCGVASKGFGIGNQQVVMPPEPDCKRQNARLRRQTGLAPREFGAPDSQAANPIPVCSPVNNYGARRAVDERRFACGWTPGAVARIPQITSLDPGRPGVQAGLQPAAARQTGAYRPAARVSSYLE